MNIKGKVAIVTGASTGIGLATAKLLAKEGAKVALVARSKDKLEVLSKQLPGSLAIQADMTKENEIKAMVKKTLECFGRIDILVNNAGQGYDAPVELTNIKTFQHIFDLDVLGPLIAIQQVVPIMRRQKEGAILNVSSGTALMALPNNATYSAMKRALAQISLTANEELKESNITVGVIYPYITRTDFEKNTIKNLPQTEEEFDESDLPHPPDSPEYVAEKIVEGIKSGETEIYAHDWMKNL